MTRPRAIETLRRSLLQLDVPSLQIDVSGTAGTSVAHAPESISWRGGRVLATRLSPSRVHLALFDDLQASVATPCPGCLDLRMASLVSETEQWLMQSNFHETCADSPYLLPALVEKILLVVRFLLTQDAKTRECQKVYSIDLLSQAITVSELLPDSFCERCHVWKPAYSAPYELTLRDTLPAKIGTSRMVAPLEYKLPSKALVNPVCGAVAANVIPGYMEVVTAPVFGQYIQRTRNGAKPHIVGWSAVDTRMEESRVIGMLEALERQAGMWAKRGHAPVIASFRELGDRAMDPTLSFSYNDESYFLPFGLTRYDEDVRMEWVWGYSLVSKRSMLVPEQLVSYARIPPGELTLVNNNSSGCALGSCYEEAILQGLLELIERDSFVIAWHRQLALPKIRASSCTDFKTKVILDRMDHLDIDISLLDARLDLDCPTVIATARRRASDLGAFAVGAAAAVNPAEAVSGALLEAATLIIELPGLLRVRDRHMRELAADHYKLRTVMEHAVLYALPEMAAQIDWIDSNPVERSIDQAFPDSRQCASTDIAQNLSQLLDRVVASGLAEVVVVDQTTREQMLLGLKTVRVIVPGLAPLDFGYPRNRVEHLPRLHSAPRAAGLEPGNGGRLNRLPHPFP